jgi:hypothetical protein
MRRIQRVAGTQLFIAVPMPSTARQCSDRAARLQAHTPSLKSVGEFLRCAKDRYKG